MLLPGQPHKKQNRLRKLSPFVFNPGDDLLSHTVASAVPSALRGLTTVFGMGTGVTPSLKSPRNFNCKLNWKVKW